jgi:hypothetical protein
LVSTDRSYVGQLITSRTIPTISVAAAIIKPGSGVKSTVTSILPPLDRRRRASARRFDATSITGTGRMYASSSASAFSFRFALCSRFGIS